MVTNRIATSGRVSVSGRVAASNRKSSISRQGYPFTLIGNGLQAFYRPDAGTVKLINGKVSSLADLSGNGHTMTQSTASRQPVWNVSGINGQPTLDFDGINDGLTCTTNIQIAKHPWTQLAVLQSSSLIGPRCVFIGTNGNGGHELTISAQGSGKREIRSSGVGQSTDGNPTTNAEVWIGQGTQNTATITNLAMWTGTALTPQTLTPSSSTTSAFSGNGSSLGCLTIGFFFWAGKIAEFLFVNRALSTSEMTQYLAYVSSRYGAL